MIKNQWGKHQVVDYNYDLERIKEDTELIDYKCNFQEDGTCDAKKHSISKDHPMCCCSMCPETYGHFSIWTDVMTHAQIIFLQRNYRKETGYWRKGTGCVIPRKWRSVTCLEYHCNLKVKSIEKAFLSTLFITSKYYHKLSTYEPR